jgi:hypothetical protein
MTIFSGYVQLIGGWICFKVESFPAVGFRTEKKSENAQGNSLTDCSKMLSRS